MPPKAGQRSVQRNDKENLPPRSLDVTVQRKVTLTRALGKAGEPWLVSNSGMIGYEGCPCGKPVFIPPSKFGDSHAVAQRLRDHELGAVHKRAEEAKAAAFAASLGPPLEAVLRVDRNRGASMPRPFSRLGDDPPSTICIRTAAGVAAVSATPAALVQASPATAANFTVPLPNGWRLPNAGRGANVDTLPGFLILTFIDGGASADVSLIVQRDEIDKVSVLDGQIASARRQGDRIGALIVQRRDAIAHVAKTQWLKPGQPRLVVKMYHADEDGEGDFADEESAYEVIDERRVSPEFILRRIGTAMTSTGQVALILEYCDGGSLATLLGILERRGETLGEVGWKELPRSGLPGPLLCHIRVDGAAHDAGALQRAAHAMSHGPASAPNSPVSHPGERAALILTSQILSGLAALHAAGIAHRDLKLANVLVWYDATETLILLERFCEEPGFHGATTRSLLKLCDFALSCTKPRRRSRSVALLGTARRRDILIQRSLGAGPPSAPSRSARVSQRSFGRQPNTKPNPVTLTLTLNLTLTLTLTRALALALTLTLTIAVCVQARAHARR